jgi:hypothetical protein
MKFKVFFILILSCVFTLLNWINSPLAFALTPIKLFDISYHDCPLEFSTGIVTSDGSGQEAKCFLITGKAENTSGKLVVDADVFGRIYDANNEPALQNRNRLGTIMEVPPGISDFEIRISVAANQPTPLQLKQFKASGFASQVRPFYYEENE